MKYDNNIYSVSRKLQLLLMLFLAITGFGCKKMIEVDPPINSIVNQDIYSTDLTAASVLTGIYTQMSLGNMNDISVKLGVSADELVSTTPPDQIINILYGNALTKEGDQLFWTDLYTRVYQANSAIEGLNASTKLSPAVKRQLIGEAKFIRAFMYFYLVNLYGDVPLVLSTQAKDNSLAARTTKDLVYQQIIRT